MKQQKETYMSNATNSRLSRKPIAGLIIVIVAMALAPLAEATWTTNLPIWNVNFNSDTVGSPPSTAGFVSNQTATKPSDFGTNAAGPETVTVMSSYGGLTDKPVRLLSTGDSSDSAPRLDFIGEGNLITNGAIRIDFDTSMVSGGTGDGQLLGSFRGLQNGGAHLFAMFWQRDNAGGGSWAFNCASGGGGVGGNWLFGETNHVTIIMNWDNDTITTILGGGVTTVNPLELGVNTLLGFRFVDAGGFASPKPYDFAIDNFSVIPEPSALALLGLSALLLRRRMRG